MLQLTEVEDLGHMRTCTLAFWYFHTMIKHSKLSFFIYLT